MGNGGSVVAKSGKKGKLRINPPKLRVEEITFKGGIPIWYTRIPDQSVTYVHAPHGMEYQHLDFADGVRPVDEFPHWRRNADKKDRVEAEFSWPAAYVRYVGSTSDDPKVMIKFSVANSSFKDTLYIKAESDEGGLEIKEKSVKFASGKSAIIEMTLRGIPKTVRWLSGITFNWMYRTGTEGNYLSAHITMHTLFILNSTPRICDSWDVPDKGPMLFEILDWSCRWASGEAGYQQVLEAIWNQFSPVRAYHSTGLVYWKNDYIGIVPAQNIPSAIQSQDDPRLSQRNAASCIVFAQIFVDCLLAHGILARVLIVTADKDDFTRGVFSLQAIGWNPTTTIAQGTLKAPAQWVNHFIAGVKTDVGDWFLYDPSYGLGKFPTVDPFKNTYVQLIDYESIAVKTFICVDAHDTKELAERTQTKVTPNPDPSVHPHLEWNPI